jgi:ribonuclease Z
VHLEHGVSLVKTFNLTHGQLSMCAPLVIRLIRLKSPLTTATKSTKLHNRCFVSAPYIFHTPDPRLKRARPLGFTLPPTLQRLSLRSNLTTLPSHIFRYEWSVIYPPSKPKSIRLFSTSLRRANKVGKKELLSEVLEDLGGLENKFRAQKKGISRSRVIRTELAQDIVGWEERLQKIDSGEYLSSIEPTRFIDNQGFREGSVVARSSRQGTETDVPEVKSVLSNLSTSSYRSFKLKQRDIPTVLVPQKLPPDSPFSSQHAKQSQSQRIKMHSYFQILSTPTADTPGATILLHFDSNRYIFGHLSEGTQRMLVDRNTKLINVKDFFLTGTTEWANTGGLLGMVLTLADGAASSAEQSAANQKNKGGENALKVESRRRLGVHGGPNITHTIATCRHFVFRKGMPLDVYEYGETTERSSEVPNFSDDNINVWAMSISPSNKTSSPGSLNRPRKRSFDEFKQGQFPSTASSDSLDLNGAQDIRKAVVKEMFDSSWRFDALFEMNLADVDLPAAIFIRNAETNRIEPYKGKLPGDPDFSDLEPIAVLVRKPWPAAEIDHLPNTSPSREALSYIVKDHDQRGKFNVKKALELKVPKGPLFNKLTKGESVISSDGKTVTADMVLDETRWSTGTAILDIPSTDYIENLVSRPEWESLNIMKGVEAMIWILGSGVATDPRWVDFVNSRKNMEHVVISQDRSPNRLALGDTASASIRRYAMDPDHFPMPIYDNNSTYHGSSTTPPLVEYGKNIRFASRGVTIQTRPDRAIKTNDIQPLLDTTKVLRQVPESVLRLGETTRRSIHGTPHQEELPGADVEIITLGTGSALPSKYRNVSATLVRVPGYGSYLLDCGENTLGQMKRVFPPNELREVLRSLKLIWISHMHADHHLGTTSVIRAWYEEMSSEHSVLDRARPGPHSASNEEKFQNLLSKEDRLFVASNAPMINWLREYSEVEDFGHDQIIPITVSDSFIKPSPANQLYMRSVPLSFNSAISSQYVLSSPSVIHKTDPFSAGALCAATGLDDLTACPVRHCRGAKGVALTFSNGFKLTYSGDCRPSDKLVEIGQDSTVLLHEATFDDELIGDAMAKRHSTISEALGIAVKMKAKRVILTHFSQRYQKLPTMENLNVGKFLKNHAKEEAESNAIDQEDLDGPIDAAVGSTAMDLDSSLSNANTTNGSSTPQTSDDNPIGTENDTLLSCRPAGVKSHPTVPQDSDIVPWSPVFDSTPVVNPPPVAAAFDYMKVKVRDIEHMYKFTPALLKLYEISGEGTGEDVMEVNRAKGKKGKNDRSKE